MRLSGSFALPQFNRLVARRAVGAHERLRQFGIDPAVPLVLEGIVTSLDQTRAVNVAPMGPIVDEHVSSLHLRPFKSSQTYQNLKQHGQGVFHVVDDVLLIARAVVGCLEVTPPTFPAKKIDGVVLEAACRWYEFEVTSFDESDDRTNIVARVLHRGHLRDFFGFNRAKHAVLEAAILATRLHLIERDEILNQMIALKVIVEKTCGQQERAAFELLETYVGQSDVELL